VTSQDGRLSALDALTGDLLWDVTGLGGFVFNAGAAVYDGVVYVAGVRGGVSALKASTGQLLWRHREGEEPHGVPTVDARAVYIADIDGYVSAYDRTTGTRLWKAHVVGEIQGSLASAGGVVYGLTDHGQILAFDASTGTQLWMDQPTPEGGWSATPRRPSPTAHSTSASQEPAYGAYDLTG
jgi:outer membrane protein assembly factor BamB